MSTPTLALQFAMLGEAAPLLAGGAFRELSPDPRYGFRFHEALTSRGVRVIVGVAGTHPRFGCDAIGTVPAALLTSCILDRFSPARVVNAGTAGGFRARGGDIGEVYLGDDVVVFHDRRIPLPGFEAMGPGHFPVECDRALAERLGFKVGVVSTGDSLDCTPEDLRWLTTHGASVKEMEAAAIAWVCERARVPLVLVKAITDLVDGDHSTSTSEQFLANYELAVTRLAAAVRHVIAHYAGALR